MTVISRGRTRPARTLEQLLEMLGCVPPEAIRMVSFWPRGHVDDPDTADSVVTRVSVPAHVDSLVRKLPTGGWRICHATARALAMLFESCRPRRVLEFGSGASTVLFAALCAHAGGGCRVVSLESEKRHAERTQQLLERHGVAAQAHVILTPVVRTRIEGWSGWMYRPDDAALAAALAGEPAQFVFIDGPANWLGRRGDCRYGTLLLAHAWAAENALFAADDALRSRDLRIVNRWQQLPFARVRGIVPVGRGLAVGTLRRCSDHH